MTPQEKKNVEERIDKLPRKYIEEIFSFMDFLEFKHNKEQREKFKILRGEKNG